MNLELILQIIGIISFFAGAIMFFVKTGEYKTNIQKDIEVLRHDANETKREIKDLQINYEKLRNETSQNTTRIEALLVEVKTKLNLIMQVQGIFKNNNE